LIPVILSVWVKYYLRVSRKLRAVFNLNKVKSLEKQKNALMSEEQLMPKKNYLKFKSLHICRNITGV